MDLSVAGDFVYCLECGENKKWGVHFSWHTCVTFFRDAQHQTYSKEKLSALSHPTGTYSTVFTHVQTHTQELVSGYAADHHSNDENIILMMKQF
jgi:hypothetical protein